MTPTACHMKPIMTRSTISGFAPDMDLVCSYCSERKAKPIILLMAAPFRLTKAITHASRMRCIISQSLQARASGPWYNFFNPRTPIKSTPFPASRHGCKVQIMGLVTLKHVLITAESKSAYAMGLVCQDGRTAAPMLKRAHWKNMPIALWGQMFQTLAQQSHSPVVAHLDHGQNLTDVKQALDAGFTSVMFDGPVPFPSTLR